MAKKNIEIELKVGIFVAIGLVLIMVAIIVLGSTQNFLIRQNRYFVHIQNVEGLIPGAKVVLAGVSVGTVETIDFDPSDKDVKVRIAVAKQDASWVRKDSTAEIATQGVLGDKFVVLSTGSPESPELENGASIPPKPSEGINEFISKGDELMVSLNSIARNIDKLVKRFDDNNRSETFFQGMATTAKNLSSASEKINKELDGIKLKSATQNLDQILEKINHGKGTVGALINDPGLYDDVKSLIGGANRSRLVRNLVRQSIKDGEKAEPAEATEKK